MRLLALGLAALFLCACGQNNAASPGAAAQAEGCARTATHSVIWTNPDAPDTITARSEGPSCKQAVVVLVARDADGEPLWTFASAYYDMTAGGVAPADAPAVSAEQVDGFLQGWANVTVQRSGQLPAWRAGAAAPGDGRTLTYSTPFAREAYEALRQRDLRIICYAASVTATQCLVIDPSSNAPTMIAAYGS